MGVSPNFKEYNMSNNNGEGFIPLYDLLNGSEMWFKYNNGFIKLYNGNAAMILYIKNDIPIEGDSSVTKFGAHAFIISNDEKLNIVSKQSIENSLKLETDLYSDTDIFSMMKFQVPYTEIPRTKTVEILLQNKAEEAKKAAEAAEAAEVETFKVQYKKFEVNIRVYKNGEVDGWFEHDIYGDEVGGSLIFERTENGIELTDFDGVMILPIEVGQVIAKLGYIINLEHFCS